VGAQSFIWMKEGCVVPGKHVSFLQNCLQILVVGFEQLQSCADASGGDKHNNSAAAASTTSPLVHERTSTMTYLRPSCTLDRLGDPMD
jgi:hypothetical protein